MLFLLSADFLQNQSECQTILVQIRPDKISGLVWVQIVCKTLHQQITIVCKELIMIRSTL